MTEPTQYPYSINFSIGSILLIIILMLLLLSNVIGVNNTASWVIYGVCALMFIFLIALLIIKRLIPALKCQTALELNEQGIIDYIRNITIDWKDVKDINLKQGRSASTILVGLKWESDYGRQIAISLRWIKGKDVGIYETVMIYFEQADNVIF